MDYNFLYRYLQAVSDTPIYIYPYNALVAFETLYAGNTYPLFVRAIRNINGQDYAEMNTGKIWQGKPLYTYIALDGKVIPNADNTTPNEPEPSYMANIGTWLKQLFILGGIAYVAANYFKGKK